MTHVNALRGLLALGPLTHPELLEITGWTPNALKSVLARMTERGEIAVAKVTPHRNVYWLA